MVALAIAAIEREGGEAKKILNALYGFLTGDRGLFGIEQACEELGYKTASNVVQFVAAKRRTVTT